MPPAHVKEATCVLKAFRTIIIHSSGWETVYKKRSKRYLRF